MYLTLGVIRDMRDCRYSRFLFVARWISLAAIFSGASVFAQARPSPGPPPIHPGQPGQMPGQNPPGQNPNVPPGAVPPQSPMPEIMPSQETDKRFVREALQSNLAEIEMGKLALGRSSNTNVRQFAERMIRDHTRMNQQMEPIARRLNVPIPAKPGKSARKQQKKLSGTSEPAFDRAYAAEMVRSHKSDLAEYERESAATQDPALRDAAAQGLQLIREHLRMAENLQKSQQAAH